METYTLHVNHVQGAGICKALQQLNSFNNKTKNYSHNPSGCVAPSNLNFTLATTHGNFLYNETVCTPNIGWGAKFWITRDSDGQIVLGDTSLKDVIELTWDFRRKQQNSPIYLEQIHTLRTNSRKAVYDPVISRKANPRMG